MSEGALVLFSGGQDSATCLAWALERHARVETIGFDYGQRHAVELTLRPALRDGIVALRPDWAARLGPDHVLDISGAMAALGGTALTGEAEIRMRADGLPNTFVPGRNLLFLVYAAALADRRALGTVVGGMCETDYSGYPDCRDATIKAQAEAIALGFGHPVAVETPLMFLDKAATWQMAQDLGGDALVALIVEGSHTCYLGERGARHDWGYGCGTCPACALRAAGWARWKAAGALPQRSSAAPAQPGPAVRRSTGIPCRDPPP